MNWQISLCTQW